MWLMPVVLFQSLTWVERLSDSRRSTPTPSRCSFNPSPGLNVFQTALSGSGRWHGASFNPSPGLNVFQTTRRTATRATVPEFQSLTWVERLSDPVSVLRCAAKHWFQSLTWVERLSDSRNQGQAAQG